MSERIKDSIFDYSQIPEGFYDKILQSGNPVRKSWHLLKFTRMMEGLPENKKSILDIGCFAGSFLSLIKKEQYAYQVGVDILDKQIHYAQQNFGTGYRKFIYIKSLNELSTIKEKFDCITLIEVIEHLNKEEIVLLFNNILRLLKRDGHFILSTPNYLSIWPVLEIILNRISEVKYHEQHVTKFNYFNINSKLLKIYPQLDKKLENIFKTTTHFLAPFISFLSMRFAVRLSKIYPHQKWKVPFGCLVVLKFRKIEG